MCQRVKEDIIYSLDQFQAVMLSTLMGKSSLLQTTIMIGTVVTACAASEKSG